MNSLEISNIILYTLFLIIAITFFLAISKKSSIPFYIFLKVIIWIVFLIGIISLKFPVLSFIILLLFLTFDKRVSPFRPSLIYKGPKDNSKIYNRGNEYGLNSPITIFFMLFLMFMIIYFYMRFNQTVTKTELTKSELGKNIVEARTTISINIDFLEITILLLIFGLVSLFLGYVLDKIYDKSSKDHINKMIVGIDFESPRSSELTILEKRKKSLSARIEQYKLRILKGGLSLDQEFNAKEKIEELEQELIIVSRKIDKLKIK